VCSSDLNAIDMERKVVVQIDPLVKIQVPAHDLRVLKLELVVAKPRSDISQPER